MNNIKTQGLKYCAECEMPSLTGKVDKDSGSWYCGSCWDTWWENSSGYVKISKDQDLSQICAECKISKRHRKKDNDSGAWYCAGCSEIWAHWSDHDQMPDHVEESEVPEPTKKKPEELTCVACKTIKSNADFSSNQLRMKRRCICKTCMQKKAKYYRDIRVKTKFGIGRISEPVFVGKLKTHLNIDLGWGRLSAPFYEVEIVSEHSCKPKKQSQILCSACYKMKPSRNFSKPRAVAPVCAECDVDISRPVHICVRCCRKRKDFSNKPYPKYYDRILAEFWDAETPFSKTLCSLCADPNISLKQAYNTITTVDEPYYRALQYLAHKFPTQISSFECTSYTNYPDCWYQTKEYIKARDEPWDWTSINRALDSMSQWDEKIEHMREELRDMRHELKPWEMKARRHEIREMKARRHEIDKQSHHFESGRDAFARLLGKAEYAPIGEHRASIKDLESGRTFEETSRRSKREACKSLYSIMARLIGKMKAMANGDTCKLCSTLCTTAESIQKHLLGHDHLKQCNLKLAETEYWQKMDLVDLPGMKKGRITKNHAPWDCWTKRYIHKYVLVKPGGTVYQLWRRSGWDVLPEEIEMPRLYIPSLATFDGTGKLRVDIENGRYDYDLQSRLDLKAVRKWFCLAFNAHVRKIDFVGAQREVSWTCAAFGWPHSVTNIVLQFAGIWGLHVYFDGTGNLWWEKGSSQISMSVSRRLQRAYRAEERSHDWRYHNPYHVD